MRTFLTLLVLAVAARGAGAEGWVYVLPDRGREIVFVDVTTRVTGSIALSGQDPAGLFPTPGGKFVFVTFRNSNLVAVVDAESRTEHRAFRIVQGVPETIAFTPMGNRAYVTLAGTDRVLVYEHRHSELTPAGETAFGVAGAPLVFNRRGTRVYRAAEGGLLFRLESDGRSIRVVRHPGGPAAWTFSPDFRTLWGASAAQVLAIDERRGALTDTVELQTAGEAPLVTPDGRTVFVLSEDRRRVLVIGGRTRRLEREIALPAAVRSLTMDPDGLLWAAAPEAGSVYAIGERVEAIVVRGRPAHLASVTLRPGEGFACF